MLQFICIFQHKSHLLYKSIGKNFPGGPVVENLPGHAGGGGLIPSQGTKILYDLRKRSQHHNERLGMTHEDANCRH